MDTLGCWRCKREEGRGREEGREGEREEGRKERVRREQKIEVPKQHNTFSLHLTVTQEILNPQASSPSSSLLPELPWEP